MLYPTRHVTGHTTTWSEDTNTAVTTADYVYETAASNPGEIIRVKRKAKARRYYCYDIDSYHSVVIVARSLDEANKHRPEIVKGSNGKWPGRRSVEHTAKRVRTLFTGYKGKAMEGTYGVFLLRNVTLNRRKIILDL